MHLFGEMFQDEPEDPKIESVIEVALKVTKRRISPIVISRFKEPKLFYGLPEQIRESSHLLASYIENTSKLEEELARDNFTRGYDRILGEEISIPESVHADGRKRRAESGFKINVDEINNRGIDPTKVLFFRVTQPGNSPKPEYYWTTDFRETQNGLSREIPSEKRATAVTLVADLVTISGKQGLIQDINDDQGLAVRQIGLDSFDQAKCIAIIRNHEDSSYYRPIVRE